MRGYTTLLDAATPCRVVISNQGGSKSCEENNTTQERKFKSNNLQQYDNPIEWKHYIRPAKLKNLPPELVEFVDRFKKAVAKSEKTKYFVSLLSNINPSKKLKKRQRVENQIKVIGCLINCTDLKSGKVANPARKVDNNRNLGEIAKFLGVHISTAQRCIYELYRIGFIKIIQIKGRASIRMFSEAFYRFIDYSALKARTIVKREQKAIRKEYHKPNETKSTVQWYKADKKPLVITEKSMIGLSELKNAVRVKPPD